MPEALKKTSVSIDRERSKQVNLDFESMRQLGIEWMQQLSGDIWTDYNIHDPGITILEALCFGLLDLGYRTEFDVSDIIFAIEERNYVKGSSNTKKQFLDQAFHSPIEIFSSSPVTIADYRKLILDQVTEVKNIWIEATSISEFGLNLKGLYKVYLQLDEVLLDNDHNLKGNHHHKNVIHKVRLILEKHRNICERFLSIEITEHVEVSIDAELEISPVAEVALVQAEVYFKLHQFMRNNIKRYSKADLIEKNYPIEKIFEGPKLSKGFIETEELKNLTTTFIVSELKELVSNIPDVIEVINFTLLINNISRFDNTITFSENQSPILNIAKSRITVHHSTSSFIGEQDMMKSYLRLMHAREEKGYYPKFDAESLTHNTTLKKAELEHYYSIQNLFPSIYGLGENGVHAYAKRKEKAAAKQLKAYLSLFDQIIANYLAQLTNASKLFSLQEENINAKESYFTQNISNENIPKFNDLFENIAHLDSFHKRNAELIKENDDFYIRKNQILDHLLARFGEDFLVETLEKVEAAIHRKDIESSNIESNDTNSQYDKILKHKTQLLLDYPRISQQKSVAGSYPLNNKEEIQQYSGAFDKIKRLLLIEDYQVRISELDVPEGFYWIENLLLYPHQVPKYKLRLLSLDGNTLLESLEYLSFKDQQDMGNQVLYYGVQQDDKGNPKHLRIKEEGGKYFVELVITVSDNTEYILKTPEMMAFDSEEKARGTTTKRNGGSLIEIFNYLKSAKEGAIENLNTLFEMTLAQERADIINKKEEQFFNHCISLIVPSWSERFQMKEFQSYVKEVVYQSLPVHIAVDFYWISNNEALKEFEEIYEQWIYKYHQFYIEGNAEKHPNNDIDAQDENQIEKNDKDTLEDYALQSLDNASRAIINWLDKQEVDQE